MEFCKEKLPTIQIKSLFGTKISDNKTFFSKNLEEVYINCIPKKKQN